MRVNDYNTEQTISVNIELEVDHRNIVRAILYKNYPIGELIKRDIRKYFAGKVSLHQFYFSLNEKGFRDEVKAHLDKSLKSVGRAVAFVSLEIDATIPTPPRSFNCECDIAYRISENSSPIIITNKVLLELQDAARYVIAGSPDLYQWVKKNLGDALSRELFRATYLDLLLRFESFKDLVRQSISRERDSIGYDIKHLIADPDMEPKRWLEGIEIRTKEAEEEYETKISKFPVRLSIVVNTRIKDLEGIKQYLHPLQDVPSLMKSAILDDIARFLRTVDPKLFHLRFSTSTDPSEAPLEETLRKRILRLLSAISMLETTRSSFGLKRRK